MAERNRRTFADWVDDLLATVRKHRHFYELTDAYHVPVVAFGPGQTVAVLSCFCRTAEAITFITFPGKVSYTRLRAGWVAAHSPGGPAEFGPEPPGPAAEAEAPPFRPPAAASPEATVEELREKLRPHP